MADFVGLEADEKSLFYSLEKALKKGGYRAN